MVDRNVQYPTRYRLQKVAGTDDIYDIVPAPGEIAAEGTLINKFALLKDSTAELFGIPEEQWPELVPDDVLAFLSNSYLHWWRRKSTEWEIVVSDTTRSVTLKTVSGNYLNTYYDYEYSSEVSVDAAGILSLVNPQTVSIAFYDVSAGSVLAGKYFKTSSGVIWKATDDASVTRPTSISSDSNSVYVSSASAVNSVQPGIWTHLSSLDRNTYPDSGIDGVYEYQYLGVPFENAREGVKIETGSYAGTGTYGKNNPNSLTFNFAPKLVLVKNSATNATNGIFGIGFIMDGGGFVSAPGNATVEIWFAQVSNIVGQTVSWYTYSSATAANQFNVSGTVYDYLAIG